MYYLKKVWGQLNGWFKDPKYVGILCLTISWGGPVDFVSREILGIMRLYTSAFSLTTLDRVLRPPGVKLFLSWPSLKISTITNREDNFGEVLTAHFLTLIDRILLIILLRVKIRSWSVRRLPGPSWCSSLTSRLRCAPWSGFRSKTPSRSGRPPSRWTGFTFQLGSNLVLAELLAM